MKYWIITDTHFGHNKIKEYCNRPDDYEYRILDNLNKCVKPDDVVIHLGDFAFYKIDYWAEKYNWVLKGACSWLILGNHDKKSAGNQEAAKARGRAGVLQTAVKPR